MMSDSEIHKASADRLREYAAAVEQSAQERAERGVSLDRAERLLDEAWVSGFNAAARICSDEISEATRDRLAEMIDDLIPAAHQPPGSVERWRL